MRGYPQFSFWISVHVTVLKIYISCIIINRGKNTFELVGTVPFSFPELRSSWPAPRIESSGRFQSVLATDWSDGNTIKMITGRNRKRMAEGILFSVCRTCNRYIISNNHPLDLFGEKTIREGIVRD